MVQSILSNELERSSQCLTSIVFYGSRSDGVVYSGRYGYGAEMFPNFAYSYVLLVTGSLMLLSTSIHFTAYFSKPKEITRTRLIAFILIVGAILMRKFLWW